MPDLYLDSYAFAVLCQALLALTVTVYLAFRGRSSMATRWLTVNFAFATLFMFALAATYASYTVSVWNSLQYVFVGGMHVGGVGFAYTFHRDPFPRERRILIWFLGVLAAGSAILLAVLVATRETYGITAYWDWIPWINLIWLAALVWRSGVHYRQSLRARMEGDDRPAIYRLIRPRTRTARGHTAFAHACLLGIGLTVLAALRDFGLLRAPYFDRILNVGLGAMLFLLVYIYLTYSLEQNSFQVKIVGFALAVVLTLFSLLGTLLADLGYPHPSTSGIRPPQQGIRFIHLADGSYRVERDPREVSGESGEVLLEDSGSFVEVPLGFAFPFAGHSWESVYVDGEGYISFGSGLVDSREIDYARVPIISPLLCRERTSGYGAVYVSRSPGQVAITWRGSPSDSATPDSHGEEPTSSELIMDRTGNISFRYSNLSSMSGMQMRGLVPGGEVAELKGIVLDDAVGQVIPAGVSAAEDYKRQYLQYQHAKMLPLLELVVAAFIFLLVIFPLLLRSSLTRPLSRLLEGIRRVNEGWLDTRVETETQDEVGLLTEHFNRMVQSLQRYSREMEELVAARTEELEQSLTRLKSTQAQLLQQEKLASLGQLTAGIAHEIKNPLNFVNNFSLGLRELVRDLRQVMTDDPDVRLSDLDDVLQEFDIVAEKIAEHGKRADEIVRTMLLHARGVPEERKGTDLNALLEESINRAFHSTRARVPGFDCVIETKFDPSIRTVTMMPQEIGRVFLNLLGNAFYAVHEKAAASNGQFFPAVKISTTQTEQQVEVRIEDNGTGIPDSIREKIFEPFFTTKPTGQGVGLGLSLAREIVVEGHRGAIDVESAEGGGTVFVVRIPIVTEAFSVSSWHLVTGPGRF